MPAYYEYPSGDKDHMQSRVEVFSWSFGEDSNFDNGSPFFYVRKRDAEMNARAEADAKANTYYSQDVIPGVFKDKIFIIDCFRLHEIYNPDKVNALYTDLPFIPNQQQQQEEDEEETSSNKRKLDDSTISDDPDFFALTGPDQGMPVVDVFDILVRKKDPTNAGHVVDYFNWDRMPGDNKATWMARNNGSYNIPRRYYVELSSALLLVLDYVVIVNSKVVTVDVKWLVPPSSEEVNHDIYICGDLCLGSDQHEDYYSLLLQTPPNKAKMVRHDTSILLSRSVVAVPVHSGFTVHADLRNPLNNSFVEGYARFENVPFSKRNECQEITKYIEGTDARMEVNVTVKLLG